jgi:hypothetical protein
MTLRWAGCVLGTHNFGFHFLMIRDPLGGLGVDGRIILNQTLEKWVTR